MATQIDQITITMMELALLAYATSENDIKANLNQKDFLTDGWEFVWSSATTKTDPNLVYVAQNDAMNAFAVVVRGTYPELDLGLFHQLQEDLDVGSVVDWSQHATQGAAIARGTKVGLCDITHLTSDDRRSLRSLIAGTIPPTSDVYVTGHSLGGCLVTVLAPWLLEQLGSGYLGTVRPFTYAAPTAGNKQFADWFDATFPANSPRAACRVVNPLDFVPMAWNNLSGIQNLVPSPGAACPWELSIGLNWLKGVVTAIGYTQPTGGIVPLDSVPSRYTDWIYAAFDQHSPVTYLKLLGASAPDIGFPTLPTLPRLPPPDVTGPS